MSENASSSDVRRLVGVALLAVAVGCIGCSRQKYRLQADLEAEQLVLEKAQSPQWPLTGFSIEMDPRSRYYDPYDRDYPPVPPDDPDSKVFMQQVAGHKGWKHWYDHGELSDIENPCWLDYLDEFAEKTEDGVIQLRLDDTMQLGLINSPTYQQQLETLYLSALDVSTERFRFDVQFFGGMDSTFRHLGSERPSGESSTLKLFPNTLLSRRFATAGELLVGLANSTVWEFFGPNRGVTTSVLNFSLVQPLLRAGGRAVALERLTIAERTLLANVRAFHRYRQGFYTNVSMGDLGVTGPRRTGGFFGGTGLTGFSGQGSGGFGGVGAATGFGRSGGGGDGGAGGTTGGTLGAGGGAGTVGGFIGLLQRLQELRNQEDNLNLQLRTLALLEANQAAGLIGLDQVLQFQQSIETERANLLQSRNGLQDSLEVFLTFTLGLPPELKVALDDTLIKQFQFIDPQLTQLENDIYSLIQASGEIENPSVDDLQKAFVQVETFRQRLIEHFQLVQNDTELLDSRSDARQQTMSPEERKSFQAGRQKLDEDLKDLQAQFEKVTAALKALKDGLKPETERKAAEELASLNSNLLTLAAELALVQVRARLESVLLETVDLNPEDATEIARANRLDWMNNRAALVDTWRLIEFNANALKSNLTIRFDGDLRTLAGDNEKPVKFRDETGTLRASVEFDAPFTRLNERNNFRQQLIQYQQDRRQLIQFEDGIKRSLRQTLRTLEQLRLNLEIQRRAVAIAVRRVDQARLLLNQPVPPPQPGQPPQQFGPTLARDLVDSLEALRDAQNNFMSVWLNYYAGRMTLMRDLGIMQIDQNGLWIDRPIEEVMREAAEECRLPPTVPDQWYRHLDQNRGEPGDGDPNVPPSPTSSALREPPLLPIPVGTDSSAESAVIPQSGSIDRRWQMPRLRTTNSLR